MHENAHRTSRIISVVAATGVALACGTNYAYSAWAPQFAERLELSATASNIIGNAGNLGMYASGIPMGMLIDSKGPRWGVFIGAVALACGYFPLYSAYEKGPGSMPVALLCVASLLTGLGSCSAFSGAIKVSASNWPTHRGTATAFPLSAFGLSALAFTTISGFAFPDNTGSYLLLLSIGTFCIVFTGMFFLRMTPPPATYAAISTDDSDRPGFPRKNSNQMRRTASHEPDITGMALVRSGAFWKLFIMLGLLCGVGLMTINNIGNNAKVLWHHWDDTASHDFIQKRQLMHVSILSFMSFMGRLASGIGSDIIVKRLHSSRFWMLVSSSIIFTLAQVVALRLENPNHLFWLSGLTGLGYGALFGTYPALVADAFGASGLGINWGAMTMSPVISGNVLNLAYGRILDSNSQPIDGGESTCLDGRSCYSNAYILTLVASALGVGWSLWCVRHEWQEKKSERRQHEDHDV